MHKSILVCTVYCCCDTEISINNCRSFREEDKGPENGDKISENYTEKKQQRFSENIDFKLFVLDATGLLEK